MDKNRYNRADNISDSVYERNRIYRKFNSGHDTQMGMVDDIWNCMCKERDYRTGGKESEIINGNTLLGLIMLGMGIFGFIMAILTYPW